MYSAIKKDGKKLYELARQGIEIPREPRDIYISTLELTEPCHSEQSEQSSPSFELRIVCSKGTYIRTLCHDIGAALGNGGTLSTLRRTRAGVFTIEMAHTLEDVIAAILTDSVSNILLPIDSFFSEFPSITLSESDTHKAKNGALRSIEAKQCGTYRCYAPNGEFLLLGEVSDNKIKTIKSFFNPP